MQTYINGSPANPERHMPRTSEVSGNLRLDVLAHQAIHGNPHCYTCGRPMTVQEAIIHRMRDQKRGEPIIPARDAMGICGKCQQVIQITQEMQDPELSKRKLRRLMSDHYRRKKTGASVDSPVRYITGKRPSQPMQKDEGIDADSDVTTETIGEAALEDEEKHLVRRSSSRIANIRTNRMSREFCKHF